MAPFNTHFLIAEKLWPELTGPWHPYYGQFCFGCVVPDVDKISANLTQKSTHFFDRTDPLGRMITHRSTTFLKTQAQFLRSPFTELSPPEQAFALGYLCHLCVDEVSKLLWTEEIWQIFYDLGSGPVAAFSALDEIIHHHFLDYETICQALDELIPLAVVLLISKEDLINMHQNVCRFARAETGDAEMAVVVEAMFSRSPDEFEQKLTRLRHERDLITTEIEALQIDLMIEASIAHSRRRLHDLIDGRCPEPGPPDLGR